MLDGEIYWNIKTLDSPQIWIILISVSIIWIFIFIR